MTDRTSAVERASAGGLSERRVAVAIAAAIALVALAARVWMSAATHSTVEDCFITLRYAENLASGHGFAYNPPAHVLGTTTPLYTLLMAVAIRLRLDPVLFGKALNILADSGTCYLLARLPARPQIGRPAAGLFAALLYALSSTPIATSIGGMETGLVTCTGMLMISAYVDRRSGLLWPAAAALFLLRPDGLALILVLAIASAIRDRRIPWRPAGLALLIVLPWLIFATAYFGSPIPVSIIAKTTVYTHAADVGAQKLDQFRRQFAGGPAQIAVTLFALVGAWRVLAAAILRARGKDDLARPDLSVLAAPLSWLAIYYGAMLASRVVVFPWYFLPPWPLFLALSALGAAAAVGSLAQPVRLHGFAASGPAASLCLALFGLALMIHLPAIRADIAGAQLLEDDLRKPLGLWLRANSRPSDRVMLEPIGTIGYYSQRPILDAIGLVSPEVLPSYKTPDPWADMARKFKPEWLVLRPREVKRMGLQTDPALRRLYRLERPFAMPGKPPELIVYRRVD
jgi:hypothetical protein